MPAGASASKAYKEKRGQRSHLMLNAAVGDEEGAVVEIAASLDIAHVASRHQEHRWRVLEVTDFGLVVHLLDHFSALGMAKSRNASTAADEQPPTYHKQLVPLLLSVRQRCVQKVT